MMIIRTKGRRGPHDVMWCVGGVAKFVSLEDAVDLAFDVLGEQMRKSRPQA